MLVIIEVEMIMRLFHGKHLRLSLAVFGTLLLLTVKLVGHTGSDLSQSGAHLRQFGANGFGIHILPVGRNTVNSKALGINTELLADHIADADSLEAHLSAAVAVALNGKLGKRKLLCDILYQLNAVIKAALDIERLIFVLVERAHTRLRHFVTQLNIDGRGIDHYGDNILCVTGIAHPEPMVAELRRSTKVKHMAFGDHHDFSARDMARIRDTFASLPGSNNIIVTTEKDAVRLRGKTTGLPVYVLPVEVAFHKSAERDFDFLVESSVRENISFLSKLSIWS